MKENAFDNFVTYAEKQGFELIHQVPFFGDGKRHESLLFMWHPDGILLRMDSFLTEYVNTADIYFNYKLKEGGSLYDVFGSGSTHTREDGICVMSKDVKQSMRYTLDSLREQGTFLSKWVERPFLWLLHYMDTQGTYDSEKINRNRIAKFPKAVRDAITP